jgi:hypothetical protein
MTSILKVDTIQDADGNNIINESSNTITVGASGDTVALGSGALQSNLLTPAFAMRGSGSLQTVTDNAFTKAQLNNADIDTDSACDTSTNYRFTVPSGKAGKYFICASLNAYTATNDQQLFDGLIYKNGSSIASNLWQYSTAANAGRHNAYSQSIVVDLAAGDYIELYGRISGGSTEAFRQDDRSMLLSGYRIGT